MIISASRRTDIPAFYARWFMNRIRQGECLVANPFNRTQVARVSLLPQDVEAIVFWTRNPAPLLPHLAELDDRGYRYYFLLTLTGYPALLEPGVPPTKQLVDAFTQLAGRVGPERVIWRYDPILISQVTPINYHMERFEQLAGALAASCRRVIVSLYDPYRKAARRLAQAGVEAELPLEGGRIPGQIGEMLSALAQSARAQGLKIQSCAEPMDLGAYGIQAGACIDAELIQRLWGVDTGAGQDPSQRPACRCAQSKDIGAYNTCRYGCLYCYATSSAPRGGHDPENPALSPI